MDATIRAEDAPVEYSALICITTCDRPAFLRWYLPHFAALCASDARFSLVVSLDGDETESLRFCEEWQVPLVYSEHREGVGISKNRVLERFSGFDYYFFIDDDTELLDGSVFPVHIELARASGIHHFSLFARHGVRKRTGNSTVAGHRIVHGLFGGGVFNFYTGDGLRRVGGWHPRFAALRRWGHTEHSYRFFRAGLAPAPFNVAEDLSGTCIWHSPPAVTTGSLPVDEDQIPAPERELIEQKIRYVPVQTLSAYHVTTSQLNPPTRLAATLNGGDRYPLATKAEKRQCRSGFYVAKFQEAGTTLGRAAALVAAAWNSPRNPELRHAVKVGLLN